MSPGYQSHLSTSCCVCPCIRIMVCVQKSVYYKLISAFKEIKPTTVYFSSSQRGGRVH